MADVQVANCKTQLYIMSYITTDSVTSIPPLTQFSRQSSLNNTIVHVRYIKNLTCVRGFLVIFLYFGLVFFELNSLLVIARQWSRKKFPILTLRPRSHVRILLYRTWAILFLCP